MVLKEVGADSAAMKSHYESKIADILSKLQDSVEAMEFGFREQLYERQELIRQLLVQLQLKNTEFVEYLTSVQDTNDRKVIDLKIEYETKLQQIIQERNALQVNAAWRRRDYRMPSTHRISGTLRKRIFCCNINWIRTKSIVSKLKWKYCARKFIVETRR